MNIGGRIARQVAGYRPCQMQGVLPRIEHYTFDADSRSVSQARHAVRSFAREHGVSGDLLDAIALAVSEACSNVVLHAYRDRARAGRMSVGLELESRSLRVHVRDEGVGLGPRSDSPGLGLGLPIIAKLADGVAVEPGPDGGTDLCMRFDLRPPFVAASQPLVA
jgi:serine/threonine-protein kinase RsbW